MKKLLLIIQLCVFFFREQVKVWWYNPRNGEVTEIGVFPTKGMRKFDPPSGGRGNDWILVLNNAKAYFPPPGQG
ncbi:MAG: hypothetical protein FWG22_00560 [Prolixibacteraceae bacterium]|nr:hypothetical protein [Prolixibacteraceae bacterium]